MGSAPSNPFDQLGDIIKNGITDAFNRVKDAIINGIVDNVWGPINRDLVHPFRKFVDDCANFFNMIGFYVNCSIKKIENFASCIFWYIIYIIQETINLIIVGTLALLGQLFGINLLPIYVYMLDIYGSIDDIFNSYTGFHLLIYPYSNTINDMCFTCSRGDTPPIKTYKDQIGIQTDISGVLTNYIPKFGS